MINTVEVTNLVNVSKITIICVYQYIFISLKNKTIQISIFDTLFLILTNNIYKSNRNIHTFEFKNKISSKPFVEVFFSWFLLYSLKYVLKLHTFTN